MIRRYIVPDGRTIVLPTSEGAAPGARNRTLAAGDVVDIDGAPSRFMRRRIAAGDLILAAPPPARSKEH